MEHTIKTDRLTLRKLSRQDIDFIVLMESRPETNEYELDNPPSASDIIKDCERLMERAEELPNKGAVKWVVSNEKEEKIGDVHLKCNHDLVNEWEIGYKFLREHWGNGYATEAVKAAIAYSFNHFSIHRMVAYINAENKNSVALAKRIGMVYEGSMRELKLINGRRYDELVFSFIKKDLYK